LEKGFKGADQVKQMSLQTLRGEMEAMRINYSEDVSSYITHVQRVANKLQRNGEIPTDATVVKKILQLLSDDFENVV